MLLHSVLSRRGLLPAAALLAPLFACQPDAERATLTAPLSASRSAASTDRLASPAWHGTVTTIVAQAHVNPLAASRAYALLGVAQYLAVQRTERGNGDGDGEAVAFRDESARGGPNRRAYDRGAIAGASVVVLSYVFPTQTQALEDMVTAQRDVGSERSQ